MSMGDSRGGSGPRLQGNDEGDMGEEGRKDVRHFLKQDSAVQLENSRVQRHKRRKLIRRCKALWLLAKAPPSFATFVKLCIAWWTFTNHGITDSPAFGDRTTLSRARQKTFARAELLSRVQKGFFDEMPPSRNRTYRDFLLTRPEWERLQMIHTKHSELVRNSRFIDIRSGAANVTQTSGIRQCGALFLPFEYLIKRWETKSTQPRYLEISSALDEGVKSLQKCFHRVDTTSNLYFICLVLDPNVKDRYFHACWEDEQYKKGMKALEKTICVRCCLPHVPLIISLV
ncbi:hypothetical protein DFH09DRAFT_1291360 [Mycena vulgaris]|nr:hypothetical protein DFH09DRAFT_1291360 [Mycena vulgaris]